jgi:IMP cyclohydrolase
MANPSGPYPGRQIFLGLTIENRPCFAYLITGRSPESRQRKVTAVENTVKIGALSGNTTLEPLRFHYTAVKYDNASCFAAVTNGLQTEAIYETYKLLSDVGTPATKDYMEKLLEGANFEPDSLHTPRIGGVIAGKANPVFMIGIKTHTGPAVTYQLTTEAGSLSGISTYKGSFENPEPTDPKAALSQIKFTGKTAQELSKYIYDISAASYKGEDIRVCALGSIYNGKAWEIAIISKY